MLARLARQLRRWLRYRPERRYMRGGAGNGGAGNGGAGSGRSGASAA